MQAFWMLAASLFFATMAVLMPMRSPLASTSAPPELPKLIGASVWMKSSSGAMPSC